MSKNVEVLREQLLKDERVQEMIRVRAYEIFEQRGRVHGHDLDDWLQAENEVISRLMRESGAAPGRSKAKSGRRSETKTKRAAKGSSKKRGPEEDT